MSTISNVQEAREALCNGELFQVGGRFINPRDIVEVDPNGGTNPIFRLEDGRTVQHDRFKAGDVGDYLAAALEYAQRGGSQREKIPPNYSVILQAGEKLTSDLDLKTVYAYNISPQAVNIGMNKVAKFDSSTPEIKVEDYTEGNSVAYAPGTTNGVNRAKVALSEARGRVVEVSSHSASNFQDVYLSDPDGGNQSAIYTGVSTISGSVLAARVDEKEDAVFVCSSFGTDTQILKYQLDGTSVRKTVYNNTDGKAEGFALDKKNKVTLFSDVLSGKTEFYSTPYANGQTPQLEFTLQIEIDSFTGIAGAGGQFVGYRSGPNEIVTFDKTGVINVIGSPASNPAPVFALQDLSIV